jgi:hypothetical protein
VDTEQALLDAFANRNAMQLQHGVRLALAARSYECILHPLGFYLIRLAGRGDTTVRLHYWPTDRHEKGTAITPYHDHVWALCSCVLHGTIENVLLELEDDPAGDYQVASINQVGNVDDVVPGSSRVHIRVKSRTSYGRGDFYEIAPREFHYTDVEADQAALTVVLATVVVEGGPRTLLPVGSAGHMPSRQPIPRPTEVMHEISQIIGTSGLGELARE